MEKKPGRSDPGRDGQVHLQCPLTALACGSWGCSQVRHQWKGHSPEPCPYPGRKWAIPSPLLRLQKGHFSSRERLPFLPSISRMKWIHHKALKRDEPSPLKSRDLQFALLRGLWEGAGLTLPFHLTQPSHSRDYPPLSKGKLRSRRPPILPEHWGWQPAFQPRSHYQLPYNEPAKLHTRPTWSSRRSWGAAGSGRGEGEAGRSGQGRETTHADEGELILFSTCILSMSVCGGEGQGGRPPLQAGPGRQKGHSCVAHRIKKVPQSAAGLAPNASSYSNQSPFPPAQPEKLPSFPHPCLGVRLPGLVWPWSLLVAVGRWGAAATSQDSKFQFTLRFGL